MNIKMDAGAKTVGAPVFGIAADLVAQGVITPDQIGTPAIDQNYILKSKNWSLFGQAEYDLTEQFTLIAGLRYSQDKKKLLFDAVYSDEETNIGPIPQFNLQQAIAAAGGGDQDTVDYDDYAARLELDYKINPDVLVFAAYNRGIKGGNYRRICLFPQRRGLWPIAFRPRREGHRTGDEGSVFAIDRLDGNGDPRRPRPPRSPAEFCSGDEPSHDRLQDRNKLRAQGCLVNRVFR
jgi:hypothetical protein